MKFLTEVLGNGRLPDLLLSRDHLGLSSSRVRLHLIKREVGSHIHVGPVVSHDRLLPRIHSYVGLSLGLVILEAPSYSKDRSFLKLLRALDFGKDLHSVGASGGSDNLQLTLERVPFTN